MKHHEFFICQNCTFFEKEKLSFIKRKKVRTKLEELHIYKRMFNKACKMTSSMFNEGRTIKKDWAYEEVALINSRNQMSWLTVLDS